MEAQVSGATFAFGGVTYTAPAGNYRIGLFNERNPALGGEVGNDVNRDGNPAGSSGIFAVLWDPAADTVWVDTNQNSSLRRSDGDADYKVNRDVGYFGTDNPATAIAERMPFVVQTIGSTKYVNIGIVSGAHGSHVAGIAAGNALFGGQMGGAAPGAKIVSSRACLFVAGCTATRSRGHDLRRQAVERRRDQHVDRRPAGAQRRQQRSLRALRPPDRAVERADVPLDRQQRPGAQHRRRSGALRRASSSVGA